MCRKLLTIVVSAVILTACTVSSDPRQGGLVGGLHGLSTGAYDARIQQRQEELTRQQSANQGLKEQSEALEREAQEQQIELAAEQKRMIKMEENLSSLEENVKRLKAKSGKQKAEIATLKRKIGDQRRQLKSLELLLANWISMREIPPTQAVTRYSNGSGNV